MNWEALAAFGETIGAFAVLITLIFFWRQMAQTNRGQNATALTMWNQMRINVSNAWAQPDSAEIVGRGIIDPTTLSTEQSRLVFHNLYHQLMIFLEMTHRMWRAGLLDQASWQSGRHMLAEVKGTPVFELWWSSVRDYYDAEFGAVVDELGGVASGFEKFAARLDSIRTGQVDSLQRIHQDDELR